MAAEARAYVSVLCSLGARRNQKRPRQCRAFFFRIERSLSADHRVDQRGPDVQRCVCSGEFQDERGGGYHGRCSSTTSTNSTSKSRPWPTGNAFKISTAAQVHATPHAEGGVMSYKFEIRADPEQRYHDAESQRIC